MQTLQGKRFVVLGVANNKSLAWAIAQKLHSEGAELAFNFLGEALEKRVRPLAQEVNATYVAQCDVTKDEEIKSFFSGLVQVWDRIDGVIHSLAYANAEDLHGSFLNVSRAGFAQALDISAYSLVAVMREAAPWMSPGSACVTLTYHGSTQIIPGYHLMGVAKAALECAMRYIAAELGAKGIRMNAVSAGPVRTLASSGIKGFRNILDVVDEQAPLKRNILPEEVGKAAYYLLSDLASGVTGEIHYVDAGFHHVGLLAPSAPAAGTEK